VFGAVTYRQLHRLGGQPHQSDCEEFRNVMHTLLQAPCVEPLYLNVMPRVPSISKRPHRCELSQQPPRLYNKLLELLLSPLVRLDVHTSAGLEEHQALKHAVFVALRRFSADCNAATSRERRSFDAASLH
jgi:hypothetical protein